MDMEIERETTDRSMNRERKRKKEEDLVILKRDIFQTCSVRAVLFDPTHQGMQPLNCDQISLCPKVPWDQGQIFRKQRRHIIFDGQNKNLYIPIHTHIYVLVLSLIPTHKTVLK